MISLNSVCSKLEFIWDISLVEGDVSDHKMLNVIKFDVIDALDVFINEKNVDLNELVIASVIITE